MVKTVHQRRFRKRLSSESKQYQGILAIESEKGLLLKSRKITIIKNGVRENALIQYEGGKLTLNLVLRDGMRKTYTAMDLFDCFGLMRADLKDIKFLCKGAKINVHTSGMSSHMSNGLVAYEMTMGIPEGELVHIFSYDESNLTNDIQEQRDFCQRWAESV